MGHSINQKSEIQSGETFVLKQENTSLKNHEQIVSAKEDNEVGGKRKFDPSNKAKDTMKAYPTMPPRAMVNGFKILPTSDSLRNTFRK